jgi:hypothetical protein
MQHSSSVKQVASHPVNIKREIKCHHAMDGLDEAREDDGGGASGSTLP